MLPDLERVIALQQLDTAAHDAHRRLNEAPEHTAALEARLESAKQQLADAKARVAENQAKRREIEKDVAMHQGRLSKFREQAMAVKTNQEYHAIQKEIGFAQTEIKTLEDKILELMLDADDQNAAVKRADKALADEQKAVDAEKQHLAIEQKRLQASLEQLAAERKTITAALDPKVLEMFERVAKGRHGVAVAEARDQVCTICHVRLRPQVFNDVRKNDSIIQCDSCQRILYFAGVPVDQPRAPVTSQHQ
ncbi:MAG TPA: C4-type zinc ribbon domain-containing protein [Vicinamibacterales bacterium]|nr:C4-type zinc ribbon domain-containing protein [Vicinamibacterales bacterium]